MNANPQADPTSAADTTQPSTGMFTSYFLFLCALFLCACEFKLVYAFWIRPIHQESLWSSIPILALVTLPCIFCFAFRYRMNKLVREGEIKEPLAEAFTQSVSSIGMTTYMAFILLIHLRP